MKNSNERWSISQDAECLDEPYFFDTKEEAINFGKTYPEFEGEKFYVALIKAAEIICDELAIKVLEEIQSLHINNDGDEVEDYLDDVKREHIKELDTILENAINEWAVRHSYLPSYYYILNLELVERNGK